MFFQLQEKGAADEKAVEETISRCNFARWLHDKFMAKNGGGMNRYVFACCHFERSADVCCSWLVVGRIAQKKLSDFLFYILMQAKESISIQIFAILLNISPPSTDEMLVRTDPSPLCNTHSDGNRQTTPPIWIC